MKRSYSGPDSGNGAIYGWEATAMSAPGAWKILDASVPSKILIKLDFFKPFKATTPPSSRCCRRAMLPI